MSGANLHALTGAYVLDALTPDEVAAFESHLRSCRDCRDEVAELRATAARLGSAAAAVPPETMRASVLAAVARTPQTPRPATAEDPGVAPRRSARRWPAVAAAAAVLVAAAIGGTAVQRERDARAEAALMSAALHVVAAPDAVSLDMDLGAAHVVASQEMGAAVLMASDVPMPPDGVYQLWMMHADGSPAPGPTFMPHDGEVMALVEGDLTDVAELAVTLEPDDGDPTMSAEVLATVEL